MVEEGKVAARQIIQYNNMVSARDQTVNQV